MAAISTGDSLLPMDDNFASGAREEATGISNLEVSFESLKLQGLKESKNVSGDGSISVSIKQELESLCKHFGVPTLLKNKMLGFLPRILKELHFRSHRSAVHAVFLLKVEFYHDGKMTVEKLVDHLALVSGVGKEQMEKKKENLIFGLKRGIQTVLPFLPKVEADISKETFSSLFPANSQTIPPEDDVLTTQEDENKLDSTELDANDLTEEEFQSFKLREDAQEFKMKNIIPLMVQSEKEEEMEIQKKLGNVNAVNQEELLEGEDGDDGFMTDEEKLW